MKDIAWGLPNMWIEPALVKKLDNPSERPELARLATAHMRKAMPGVDIEFL